MNDKVLFCWLLIITILTSCCKPSDFEMTSINIPNRYIGLDSLYNRMAANDTITIVCYGNSITYGGGVTYPQVFQNQLRQQYNNPNITVVNEGHPGWTAEMAANAMDTLVIPKQPDLITIIFGINDLYQEKGLTNYRNNLASMVNELKQLNIPVIVMSPTPLFNKANDELVNFCRVADEVAAEYNVAFFNMHHAMVARIYAETDKPLIIMPDEIHYTDEGYSYIGEELMKYWLAK